MSPAAAGVSRARRVVRKSPGTRRVSRVEENTAADGVGLSPAQLHRLANLEPAAGARHDETNMASIDR